MDAEKNSLVLYVIITIVVMLLLIAAMLLIFLLSQKRKTRLLFEMQKLREEQQNQLIEAAIRSEEVERHRIAEELHDEVGAMLSATKLHFSAVETHEMKEDKRKLFAYSKELLNESIQKVRAISHNLHSSILKELGLNEAINHFANKLTAGGSIQYTSHLDHEERVAAEKEITIYRMVQELLNNIIKHSHASKLTIESRDEGSEYVLEIKHDGDGLSQEQFETLRFSTKGLGLKNIQNRVILLRGNILFSKSDGENIVRIRIPQNP